MRTLDTTFANFKDRDGAQRNFILSLTDGTNTWYFSRWPVDLTDGECYPILSGGFNITEGASIYTRRWKKPKCTLTIGNAPYIKDDGAATFSRPSDVLADIRYQEAKLYLAVGGANSLSDMELAFAGLIADEPESSTKTMRVIINDYSRQRDIELPLNVMEDTFGGTPAEFRKLYIPLVYGSFVGEDDTNPPTGLAVAIPTSKKVEVEMVVSDHVLDVINEHYTKLPQLPDVTLVEDTTFTLDDSGRSTMETHIYTYGQHLGETKIRPRDNNLIEYSAIDYPNVNMAKSIDRDPTTYMEVIDYYDSGSGVDDYMKGYAPFCMDDYASDSWMADNDIGIIDSGTYDIEILATFVAQGVYWDTAKLQLIYGDSDDSVDIVEVANFTTATAKTLHSHLIGNTTDPPELRDNWAWSMRSGKYPFERIPDSDNREFPSDTGDWSNVDFNTFEQSSGKLHLVATAVDQSCYLGSIYFSGFTSGRKYKITYDHTKTATGKGLMWFAGTTENIGTLKEGTGQAVTYDCKSTQTSIRLIADSSTSNCTVDNVSVTDTTDEVYPIVIACSLQTKTNQESGDPDADGTTYNQWLMRIYDIRLRVEHRIKTFGTMFADCKGYEYGSWITGRSSGYADGDAIEDPIGIIEGVLRNHIGMANADIDLPNFIGVENASVKARINLHSDNRLSVYKIIQKMAEQSTFCFYWGCDGIARAFNINDDSPSVDRTFTWEDIIAESLTVSKSSGVINKLTVQSRYRQEFESYSDVDVVEDTTSQTTYDGTYSYDAEWPNIAGTSVDHVTDLLVNSTDGIWSKDHYKITFETPGWKDYDLQPGDYVAMDNDSVGAHLSCKGNTWTSRTFLITEANYRHDKIKFTAIELFE